jgi:hypothetical protein
MALLLPSMQPLQTEPTNCARVRHPAALLAESLPAAVARTVSA